MFIAVSLKLVLSFYNANGRIILVRFFAAICPYCGGSFQAPEGTRRVFCVNCGRQIFIEEYDQRTKMEIEHKGASPYACAVCGDTPSGECSGCHVHLCRIHLTRLETISTSTSHEFSLGNSTYCDDCANNRLANPSKSRYYKRV